MNAQLPNQSLALSLMFSRAAYRAVVGIENLARFGAQLLRSAS
ncbi:hypothetical protein [Hoeflea ulvae]|uniref:Uncharacterized protein n=1 Tax=Hoeflea ulvae TaxID=2983764 RepID=A0ABT3YIC7_9HYPH|nr:hypothetical protein [Hoeflea ulvae]MCY0095663.1 hypothetical protein [Hoeflea ulvae]